MTYKLIKTDGLARRGSFSTTHGTFQTPNFMPVGTKATVKGVDVERLSEIGAEIMLVNTYHLWVRPGQDCVAGLGGIHKFSGWKGPILSDSGGFQVFSLKSIRKISEEGVHFNSHVDGAKLFLTPELSVQIQETLGVDIAMMFDECPSGDMDYEGTKRSWERTFRWAKRGVEAKTRSTMSLFGITQGGIYRDLRTQSAEEISTLPFDGYAIGGLSVGEPKPNMYDVLSYHPQQLPNDKIRYLMGVGTPQDLVEAVSKGVDLFDCVMPTRSGRFGRAFVLGDEPYINIKNAEHAVSTAPLDSDCACLCCRNYSRGYLNHLFKMEEMLGPQLLSIHNLYFYLNLMTRMRHAIEQNSFTELYKSEMSRWANVPPIS